MQAVRFEGSETLVEEDNFLGNALEETEEPIINSTKSFQSLLKSESSFKRERPRSTKEELMLGKRLTFADEHNDILVVNIFVDQLYYRRNDKRVSKNGFSNRGGCCSVS
mmetsp:Transcript_27099/g.25930  ORF Transcript_27099/g.25930 Transcript_27099/m.25930 type:complete len:109 (+) Transcript_27099:163-489(+)